jgi:hypothetical protein
MQKMIALKLFQVSEEGGIKEMVEGINSNMIYLIYFENFCKCHNVPPPSTTIKEKNKNLCDLLSVSLPLIL